MRPFITAVFLTLLLTPAGFAADPAAEVSAFSVFPGIDLAKLAKGDVMTARGPASSVARQLAVQSCYVVSGPPAKAIEALRGWDPSKHRELKIYLHLDLPSSPKPADFARLSAAPDNSSVRALAAATEKLGPELQISREEAKKPVPAGTAKAGFSSEPIRAFWADVLANRAQLFAAGGAPKQPAYDHSANDARPGDEFAGLLRAQDKVRKQFSGFLGNCGVSGGPSHFEQYAELLDVEDDGVLTLGAFSSKAAGAGFQAADVLYYASGGYYVDLTLYQMWPVDIAGQPSTLVWRGDMISAASLGTLRGTEKLASESAMMKDISKAVGLLKRDTGH